MRISYEQLKMLVQLTQQEAEKYQTPELDELATELDGFYSVTLTSDTVSLVAEQEAQPVQSPQIILKVFPMSDTDINTLAEVLQEHFPCQDTLVSIGTVSGVARDDDRYVCLRLNRDQLTDEQCDWFHLSNFANLIGDYVVDNQPITIETIIEKPTLQSWQVEAVKDILANNVTKVSSNSHNRYYTENCADRQWYELHHLIDLDGNQSMYSDLTITQCSTEGGATQIKLSHNEVDDLLTILLQWRMDIARANHEIATQKDDAGIGINDEKPF